MGVVVEGAGDQHVEPRLGGFAGGGDEVHAGEGAELRADQDAGAALGLAFQEAAFGADIFAGPGLQAGEVDAVGFWVWCTPAVRRWSSTMAAKSTGGVVALRRRPGADGWANNSSSSAGTTRCGDRLSTVKGPATRMRDLSS